MAGVYSGSIFGDDLPCTSILWRSPPGLRDSLPQVPISGHYLGPLFRSIRPDLPVPPRELGYNNARAETMRTWDIPLLRPRSRTHHPLSPP